ncbi:MAG: hypothetical protein NT150_07155 [Bacteroidetes bacterium]|nr:hypothetical protein [Bacteroidota bacterium]
MEKITSAAELQNAIQQLEIKRANEYVLLTEQFHTTYESLKPLNIIKNTFNEVTSSPNFKDDLLGVTVGMATGYLSKAILIGATHNPIKKLLGTILQMGVSTAVAKNPDTIKSVIGSITDLFSKKKESKTDNN